MDSGFCIHPSPATAPARRSPLLGAARPLSGWPMLAQALLMLAGAFTCEALAAQPAAGTAGARLASASTGAALPDPTRPPMALQLASNGRLPMGLLGPDGFGETPKTVVVQAVAPLPQLQGIQVGAGAQGRATAMLDGQLVKVGDKLGPWQVNAIDSQGVTLQGEKGPTRLSLLGGDKQPAGSIVISRSTSFTPGDSPWPAGGSVPGAPNGSQPALPPGLPAGNPAPAPAAPAPGRATHTAAVPVHHANAPTSAMLDLPAVGQVRRTPAAAELPSTPPLTSTATPVAAVEKVRP